MVSATVLWSRSRHVLVRHRFLLVIIATPAVGVVASIVFVRHALNLQSGVASQSTLTAAALALSGSLIASVVALVGYLLKLSIDRGNLAVARSAEQRALLDQNRLMMETAIATVRVLATSDGQQAPVTQGSAALIVLSRLGELELALELAAELWPAKGISSSTATFLCDQALMGTSPQLQRVAATLMLNNWRQLTDKTHSEQIHWPPRMAVAWPDELDAVAKDLLIRLLREWTKSSEKQFTGDFRQRLLSRYDQPNN